VVPDSQAGLLVPSALGWQWLAHLDRTTSGWVLLAALCLLVFHAATAVAAGAPAAAALHRDLVQPAAQRTAAIALVTATVWVAVRWSPLTGRPGHQGLTAVALLALTLVAAWAITRLSRTGRAAG
jgi:flagellar biogenesis protein FliO